MYNLSKIMTEAHARAKADFAFDSSRKYSYYLGLQMRSGFAEARTAVGCMVRAFQIIEPARWAGTPSRR